MLGESSMFVRKSSFQVSDYKAHIFVQVPEATSSFVKYKFVECHNHHLLEPYNRDFTKNATTHGGSDDDLVFPFLSEQARSPILSLVEVNTTGGSGRDLVVSAQTLPTDQFAMMGVDLGLSLIEVWLLVFIDPYPEANAEDSGVRSKEYVHIHIQQRNGRKKLTTLQVVMSEAVNGKVRGQPH
ncbi:hypothetical protein R6Q59_019065 [Mikania micrantha]